MTAVPCLPNAKELDPADWTHRPHRVLRQELPSRPRVFVVSDIRLYRDALQQDLTRNGEVLVLGGCGTDNAAEQVAMLDPDVVVVDATVPGAVALVSSLKACALTISIVVIASGQDQADFLAWVEAGVNGYADQNSSMADLTAAVQHAAKGEVVCSPRLAGLLASRVAKLSAERHRGTNLNFLTRREHDVMALLAEGLSNKAIARQLGISDTTTKNHVHNILEKLGLQSRGQAAAHYQRTGQHRRALAPRSFESRT